MILEVSEIDTFYGMSQVLFKVSLNVDKGEIVGLLGRNGAGKTTIVLSIMRLAQIRSGSIKFKGEAISHCPTYTIARRGMGYVPAERRIFGELTVRGNLMTGMRKKNDVPKKWSIDRVYDLFPALKALDSRRAGALSGGEQQMLAIGRSLLGDPTMLLLDEPSTGLAPIVVNALGAHIQSLRKEGEAILLTEQNVMFAVKICDRCYIIDSGQIVWHGTINELQRNQTVMKTYLAI